MIKTILSEYGLSWAFNRALYSVKLKSLRTLPALESTFEKKVTVKRTGIFDIATEELRRFLEQLPTDEKKSLLDRADRAIEGKLMGFSSVELDFGNPIDWQLNPLTGKCCSEAEKWYTIPDFDPERGDIKVIWEASRFAHFILFVRAYLLSGEKKYAEAFVGQLHDWIKKNPYSYGANYKCGQECSIRMVNAMLAYSAFSKEGEKMAQAEADIKILISRCYRKVLSNFFYAEKCIKNNHTISELMGMIIGAWCCQDDGILKKAYKKLDKVICEQFTQDGGYCQFSFNYQRLALQDIECILSISKSTKIDLSKEAKERCLNAARLMYQCQDEITYDMPNYGSNDGALIFPMTSCTYRDFRPVINTIYTLITGKKLYSHAIHEEELIWWGKRNITDIDESNEKRKSSLFVDAGITILRSDKSHIMTILNDYHSRPAHMDQLHVDFWIDGINILCDAGTYSYASDEGKKLVADYSHNTAVVEGTSQMNTHGPFMVYGWTKRRECSSDGLNFIGKYESVNGYSHSRKIQFNDDKICIQDRVDSDLSKEAYIYFHTPCQVIGKDDEWLFRYNDKDLCNISFDGRAEIVEAYRSVYYLKKEKIKCLKVKCDKNKVHNTIIRIC